MLNFCYVIFPKSQKLIVPHTLIKKAFKDLFFKLDFGIFACIKARKRLELNEFLFPEEVTEVKNCRFNLCFLILLSLGLVVSLCGVTKKNVENRFFTRRTVQNLTIALKMFVRKFL